MVRPWPYRFLRITTAFDFRITTAFRNYGVKNKRKSQYANEYSLTAALLQRPLAGCFDDRGF